MKKSELALKYLPYYSAHSAVNRLMSWISGCPGLLEKLVSTGYRTKQRNFSPMQVRLIYEYLGEP